MVIGSLPTNANEEGVRRVLDWVCLDCYCRADSDSPVQETMPLLSSETQVPSIRNVRIESSEYTVDLPTFLIQRACANSALVNYFYWWLVYFHPSTYPPPFYFDPSHRFICLGFFLLSLHTAWLIYLCKCSLGGGVVYFLCWVATVSVQSENPEIRSRFYYVSEMPPASGRSFVYPPVRNVLGWIVAIHQYESRLRIAHSWARRGRGIEFFVLKKKKKWIDKSNGIRNF